MWNASLNYRFLDAYISRLWWYNRCDAIMSVVHLHVGYMHQSANSYCVQNESKLKSMIRILCSVMTRTSLGRQNKTYNVIFERVHFRLVRLKTLCRISCNIFLDMAKATCIWIYLQILNLHVIRRCRFTRLREL